MEKHEERYVIKFLFMKGLSAKAIHRELEAVLHENACSEAQVKRWVSRFQNGDLSCDDQPRPGRPTFDLADSVAAYLNKFQFSSCKHLAKHFMVDPKTMK